MLRWINGTSEFKVSEGSGSADVISDEEDFVEGSGDADDEDFNQGLGSGEENLQQPPTISEITIPTKSFINLLSREQLPKISPQNPTNSSQNNCRIALKCIRKCKKYKKSDWQLCMDECRNYLRNYGVTKKTSIYLSPCTAESNSM